MSKDISKFAESDGHFRRKASAFRDFIEKDGKFTPDKGLLLSADA